MSPRNKKIIWTILVLWALLAMFFFYLLGGAVYEPFYRLTLSLIREFSHDKLHFTGKLFVLFFGDPKFGLVFSFLPATFLLCYLIVAERMKKAFWWTLSIYSLLLILSYMATCYYLSFYFILINDFYNGQPLSYHFSRVDVNSIMLTCIIATTALVAPINFIMMYRAKKRSTKISVLHRPD